MIGREKPDRTFNGLRGTFVVVFRPEGADELRTITNLESEQAMGDYLQAGIIDLAEELDVKTSTLMNKMEGDMLYLEEAYRDPRRRKRHEFSRRISQGVGQ